MAGTITTTAGAQNKPTESERFTSMVMSQYNAIGHHDFTEQEKRLIRNYFVCIDQMLQKAEADRLRKNAGNKDHARYDNNLPYNWNTINLEQLAKDLAHYAHVGLDMMEDNTLFPIPYKDNKGERYVITLMPGYNGLRYEAEKYALDPFRSVTVEVVYSNDRFRAIKRSSANPVEGYEFEITDPFNRGEIVGVFGYIEYADATKNKLVVFSKADVLKRKPRYASPEFWGGKKTVWENGSKIEVDMEGWLPEMYEKTMKREIYGSKRIPRDPAKVDESYAYIRSREAQYIEIATEAEAAENGNKTPLSLPQTQTPLPSSSNAPAEPSNPPEPFQDEIDDELEEAPF